MLQNPHCRSCGDDSQLPFSTCGMESMSGRAAVFVDGGPFEPELRPEYVDKLKRIERERSIRVHSFAGRYKTR